MDTKMTIIAKEGTALLGNHFHTLEDRSVKIFSTRNPADFIKYCQAEVPPNHFELFYNAESITAWPVDVGRETRPIAQCHLKATHYLTTLESALDKTFTLESFELLLRSLRFCLDGSGIKLLSIAKDFTIAKAVSFTRSKDNAGNISIAYKREANKGAGDFVPPEQILIQLPVFDFIDASHTFAVDFFFDFKEADGTATPYFKIQSLLFRQELEQVQKEIISNLLSTFDCPSYFGSINIEKMDNGWMYQANAIRQ